MKRRPLVTATISVAIVLALGARHPAARQTQPATATVRSAIDAIIEAPIKAGKWQAHRWRSPQVLTYRGGDTFGVKDTLVTFEREGGRVARLKLDAVFGFYPLVKKPAGAD